MDMYHASISGAPDGTYSHFGSLLAALQRVESIFYSMNVCQFDANNKIFLRLGAAAGFGRLQNLTEPSGQETIAEHLVRFAKHMETVTIYRAELDLKKILPITDCWDNDPIGSGGPAIFAGSQLSVEQKKDAEKIFAPFRSIIEPHQIFAHLNPSDITRMGREVHGNAIACKQLATRRKVMGETVYMIDKVPETVWAYMTMKLRAWTLKQCYDAFSYVNAHEGDKETSYVTLSGDQIKNLTPMRFDAQAYYEKAAPLFEAVLLGDIQQAVANRTKFVVNMWCGLNVEEFLLPVAPAQPMQSCLKTTFDKK